jgi:hypothetical protein
MKIDFLADVGRKRCCRTLANCRACKDDLRNRILFMVKKETEVEQVLRGLFKLHVLRYNTESMDWDWRNSGTVLGELADLIDFDDVIKCPRPMCP